MLHLNPFNLKELLFYWTLVVLCASLDFLITLSELFTVQENKLSLTELWSRTQWRNFKDEY